MKALQSVGQVIGEILKQLDDERCKLDVSLWTVGHELTRGHTQSLSRLPVDRDMSFRTAQPFPPQRSAP